MPSNTNIITTTAKEAVKRTVVNYGAGVYAHTTGDWSKHNVIRVYNLAYLDNRNDQITVTKLRLLLTRDDGSAQGVDTAFEIPANPSGQSALTFSPPIIIQQPRNTSAPPNIMVQLLVAVISDIPVTYQWYKNNSAIFGKTAASLVFPSVQTTDQGVYSVACTNANGTANSTGAELRVEAGLTGADDSGSFIEELPPVRFFNFLSDLF